MCKEWMHKEHVIWWLHMACYLVACVAHRRPPSVSHCVIVRHNPVTLSYICISLQRHLGCLLSVEVPGPPGAWVPCQGNHDCCMGGSQCICQVQVPPEPLVAALA
jgi:hypothetical protein